MKRLALATALAVLLCAVPCLFQNDFLAARAAPIQQSLSSPRLSNLEKELKAGNRAALESFWQEIAKQGTPIIEPIAGDDRHLLVTFVWRAKEATSNVVVFAGLDTDRVEKNRMARMLDTDLWHKTYRIRNDARFTYYISPNDSLVSMDELEEMADILKRTSTWQPDPLNPRRMAGGLPKLASVVELPAAPPQPFTTRAEGVPAGKLEKHSFKSAILGNERNVWVYTPPGYSPSAEPYGLLLVFDGISYIFLVPAQVILENMLAKGLIPPLVMVNVDYLSPEARNKEFPCYPPFAEFMAKELIPWVRQNYRVTTDPRHTVIAGSSYGGLAATYVGFRHPEIFGNVLSQSGSFWWSPDGDAEHEWLTRQFVSSPKLPLRFYMDVGLFERGWTPGNGPDMVLANRHLRNVLEAKGYSVHYREFNGGHEYLNWRGTFSDGLLALIGKKK